MVRHVERMTTMRFVTRDLARRKARKRRLKSFALNSETLGFLYFGRRVLETGAGSINVLVWFNERCVRDVTVSESTCADEWSSSTLRRVHPASWLTVLVQFWMPRVYAKFFAQAKLYISKNQTTKGDHQPVIVVSGAVLRASGHHCMGIASGLEYLHKMSIVHADLKSVCFAPFIIHTTCSDNLSVCQGSWNGNLREPPCSIDFSHNR